MLKLLFHENGITSFYQWYLKNVIFDVYHKKNFLHRLKSGMGFLTPFNSDGDGVHVGKYLDLGRLVYVELFRRVTKQILGGIYLGRKTIQVN